MNMLCDGKTATRGFVCFCGQACQNLHVICPGEQADLGRDDIVDRGFHIRLEHVSLGELLVPVRGEPYFGQGALFR